MRHLACLLVCLGFPASVSAEGPDWDVLERGVVTPSHFVEPEDTRDRRDEGDESDGNEREVSGQSDPRFGPRLGGTIGMGVSREVDLEANIFVALRAGIQWATRYGVYGTLSIRTWKDSPTYVTAAALIEVWQPWFFAVSAALGPAVVFTTAPAAAAGIRVRLTGLGFDGIALARADSGRSFPNERMEVSLVSFAVTVARSRSAGTIVLFEAFSLGFDRGW